MGKIYNKNSNKEPIVEHGENMISLDEEGLSDVTYVESTEDGDVLPTKDITKKLREELKAVRKEKEEYLTGWQRAKADYVNLQKELDSSRLSISIIAKEKMARNLMPALDSFDMAFGNKEAWEKVDKNWRMGVEYIYSQMYSVFESRGLSEIGEVGEKMDPRSHVAIEEMEPPTKEQSDTVAEVVQKGYRLHSKVIRPAKVKAFGHNNG